MRARWIKHETICNFNGAFFQQGDQKSQLEILFGVSPIFTMKAIFFHLKSWVDPGCRDPIIICEYHVPKQVQPVTLKPSEPPHLAKVLDSGARLPWARKFSWSALKTCFPSSQAGNRFTCIQVWNHSTVFFSYPPSICRSGNPAPSSRDVFNPGTSRNRASRNPLVWRVFSSEDSSLDSILICWACGLAAFSKDVFSASKKRYTHVF